MGSRNLPTMIFTKDSIKEVNSMVKESIAGLMDHHIKEILLTAADMGKEIGDLQENPEIFTLEGTKMIKMWLRSLRLGEWLCLLRVL